MRADDIRGLSDADLVSRVAELEEERFRLRFRSATQTLEDPLRLRAIRKDVARLKTVQQERALGIQRNTAAAEPANAGRGRKSAKSASSAKSATAGATKRAVRRKPGA